MRNDYFELGIVGFGPRGLHALELFYISLSRKLSTATPRTMIFESRDSMGTGIAWDPTQTEVNLINIADRALEPFQGRPEFQIKDVLFDEFPGFLEWMATVMDHTVNPEKDAFVPRKVMGAYLSHRTKSLIEPLQSLGLLEICKERVVDLKKMDNSYQLETTEDSVHNFNQVILALGHLETRISDQNQSFLDHEQESEATFVKDPYCDHAHKAFKETKSVAIKGLGLSMIDVVGMVVENNGGTYDRNEDDNFLSYSGPTDYTVVPFSLDGLPVVPKPLGKVVDQNFDLGETAKDALLNKLKKSLDGDLVQSIEDILKPIANYISDVYISLDQQYGPTDLDKSEIEKLLIEWFQKPEPLNDHFINADLDTADYVKLTCEMACGLQPFALDYVAGQVWRQLQPDLYNVYSHSKLDSGLMAALTKVDEQSKRYSFGPPVESMLQLLALHEAGIITFDYVADPNIDLVPEGFQLTADKSSIVCDTMVDAVLSNPNLTAIDDPLIKSLLEEPLAEQIEEDFGIMNSVTKNHLLGSVEIAGLYSIGRNTKGSVYGVDAILECFNDQKLQPMIDRIVSLVEIEN